MKKLLIMLLGMLMTFPMMARDFEYTYEGQTLTYTVISEDDKTCMTKEGDEHSPGNPVSGDLVIPSVAIDGDKEYSVTEIGNCAFKYCSGLITVTIPESVTKIETNAFSLCSSLVSVTIPGSVNYIGLAFVGSSSITSVYYGGEDPIEAPHFIFAISVYNNATLYVPAVAVDKCKLIDPWKNFKNIEVEMAREFEYTYEGQTLTYTVISEVYKTCMTKEGDELSPGNPVSGDLVIPAVAIDGENEYIVTVIGEGAFNSCTGLSSISIPNSVTKIGDDAFYCCSALVNITIPNSVTEIGRWAFSFCSGLTSITIPGSVTELGNFVFKDSSNLRSVYYRANDPIESTYYIFEQEVFENATLYVPAVAVEKCRLIDPWKNFKSIEAYDPSGIEDVALDDSPCEVYTVSGVKVGDSTDGLTPGIYIVRQGNAVKKIAVN